MKKYYIRKWAARQAAMLEHENQRGNAYSLAEMAFLKTVVARPAKWGRLIDVVHKKNHVALWSHGHGVLSHGYRKESVVNVGGGFDRHYDSTEVRALRRFKACSPINGMSEAVHDGGCAWNPSWLHQD